MAVMVAVASTPVASAADMDTITVTAAGPNKTIPTNAPFYLAGTVDKSVDRVQVFVVRTGSPTVFRNHGLSCEVVAAKLTSFAGSDPKQIPPIAPGESKASSIWAGGPSSWDVKVIAPWQPDRTKPPDKDKPIEFKVLLEKDSDFFSAGHGFCFFIYQETAEGKLVPDATLAEKIFAAIAEYARCFSSCSVNRTEIDAHLGEIQDTEARVNAKAQVENSYNTAFALYRSEQTINGVLTHWEGAIQIREPGASVATSTPLGKALLKLMRRANVADKAVTPTAISVAKAMSLTVPAAELQVSVRELLDLAAGRFVIAGKPHKSVEVAAHFEELFKAANAGRKLEPKDLGWVAAVREKIGKLARTLDAIRPLAANDAGDDPLPDLARWLTGEVELPCAASNQDDWKLPALPCVEGAGWNSYEEDNPLTILDGALEKFEQSAARWVTERPAVARTIVTASLLARPFGARVEMTREVWAFSYLSPVIGYALTIADRNGTSEPITLQYYGVQLHLRPNPEHKPERDLGVVALELGMTPGIGSFGPDRRFRGVRGIAPIFIGVAVHPIPYTSLSAGVMFADKRSTTLTQESYSMYYGGYIALSVDFNIPELVRRMFSKTSTTTATPAKS